MFVLSLNKNIIFFVVLKDCGYDVIFSKGKSFLRHIATGYVKQIRVCVKNLYRIYVEDSVALRKKAEKVQCNDVCELWNKRIGHFRHGTLNII